MKALFFAGVVALGLVSTAHGKITDHTNEASTSTFCSACCQNLNLDSLGMSHFEQADRVGDYEYYKTELSGKYTYRQVSARLPASTAKQ